MSHTDWYVTSIKQDGKNTKISKADQVPGLRSF